MTLRKILVLVFIISILSSCGEGYSVDGDKVYFTSYFNGGLIFPSSYQVDMVDANTFEELTIEEDSYYKIGKDKNHIFVNGVICRSIDPHTFKYIGNGFCRDKKAAFYLSPFSGDIDSCEIKGVDPNEIQIIKHSWAKAGNFLIYGTEVLYLEDIKDFKVIDQNFGRTKKYKIWGSSIVKENTSDSTM
jgi:hypothetical protein